MNDGCNEDVPDEVTCDTDGIVDATLGLLDQLKI